MKLTFGDIVVVEDGQIGVVVKSWIAIRAGKKTVSHEVYVRSYNCSKQYQEEEIQRYLVRHKYLSEEETYYQNNAINDL